MRTLPKMTFLLILAAAPAACGPAAAGPGSAPAGWTIYLEADHGFSLAYPPDGRLTDQQAGYTRIDLPIEAGTTLVEKYVEVTISQDAYPCPTTTLNTETASPPQETTVNGLTFLEQSGGGVATGNIYEWVGYSTRQGNVCAGLTFVLHYTDPANYMDPPPVFDRAAEEQVFTVILGTFQWAGP